MYKTIYLGLGSNSIDKVEMLKRARILVSALLGEVVKVSKLYATDPWGYEDQPIFINQVIEVRVSAEVEKIIEITFFIEQQLGKKKTSKLGPRNIDIDILLVDDLMYSKEDVEIPHPRLHLRNFVLIPLAEIAPGLMIPDHDETVESLLNQCTDKGKVTSLSE